MVDEARFSPETANTIRLFAARWVPLDDDGRQEDFLAQLQQLLVAVVQDLGSKWEAIARDLLADALLSRLTEQREGDSSGT